MLKPYSELQDKLMQITTACGALSKDAQVKKYRFDLQKAISTPINAISGQSGEHLLDKIRRLRAVLSGQRVQVTGRQVSASDHPQGGAYCFNLLAQKIVVSALSQSFGMYIHVGVFMYLCGHVVFTFCLLVCYTQCTYDRLKTTPLTAAQLEDMYFPLQCSTCTVV